MSRRSRHVFIIQLLFLVLCLDSSEGGELIQFSRDIQPILSNHCYACHGPDEQTRESGVRFDQRLSALSKGNSGATAITPGNLDLSEVYRRIVTDDPDLRMPPTEQANGLSPQEIELIKQWILAGAEYEEHWSFIPPNDPQIGVTKFSEWVRNPIDVFVGRKLEEKGRVPSDEASPETLIRRVSFDLTGLPPTIDEQLAFFQDHRSGAYERMVERYLNSPNYGEHLARYWLDLARYADTNGYQYDTEREQWAWRDWVINAYNQNMPFDQFTIQQLAGDLLPESSDLAKLATGFNRNHGITIEGGIIDEEYRTEYVMDRVTTTGSVWLGMTIGCARCHDHKYDPISQKEFYELFDLFNQVPERGMRGFAPQAKIQSPLGDPRIAILESQIRDQEKLFANPQVVSDSMQKWIESLAANPPTTWEIIDPTQFQSSGGSTLSKLDDHSILVSGNNPQHDIYVITGKTHATNLNAIRLEALTHESLPGGGPGRHTNSNFVLSEFEVEATSLTNPEVTQQIQFAKAISDYSQVGYDISKTIDEITTNSNGWAVDGPTRKQSAHAIWISDQPFGFEGGTALKFTLKHQANFATHGIGRPRFSVTSNINETNAFQSIPYRVLGLISQPFRELTSEQRSVIESYYLTNHNPHETIQKEIQTLKSKLDALVPATMIMSDMPQRRVTHILNRGVYDQPTTRVNSGIPACLNASGQPSINNRLDFANWLMDAKHPLTARVVANRHWRRLFGRGLVETAEDFGIQGDFPSHPDLLDWLATQLIKQDWDIKHLQREILTSATYRQSSFATRQDYLTDPDNQWLARGPRFRLDGEQIRDAALAASGLLQSQLGGKSVFPYQPEGLWLELNNRPGYSQAYPQGIGPDLLRRSIYSFWKRTIPSPMLKTLDAPEREFCTVRRSRTNTPLQALLMLNGTQFMEASVFLAARMMTESDNIVENKIAYGFQIVTSRIPTRDELDILLEEYQDSLATHTKSSGNRSPIGEVTGELTSLSLDQRELQAFTNVARIIFNLDESITKN